MANKLKLKLFDGNGERVDCGDASFAMNNTSTCG